MSLSCAGVAAAADASVVDRAFSSNLSWPSVTAMPSASGLWALDNGGAVVEFTTRPGLSTVSNTYYSLGPDGRVRSAVNGGSYFRASPVGQFVAAVLRDGSFVMATPPFRRDSAGTEIAFSPPEEFETIALATLLPDGKLLIARDARLARVFPDGAIDPSFAADTRSLTLIWAISVDSSGRVIVSGTAGNSARILRLTSTGAADPTFTPITVPSVAVGDTYLPQTIRQILRDGRIITSPPTNNANVTYTRYNADGTADRDWNIGPLIVGASTLAFSPSGETYAVASDSLFRLTAGPTPQVDPNFFSRSPAGAKVEAITVTPDGKLLVVGNFTSWDGFATSSIVRLDPALAGPVPPPSVTVSSPIPRGGARIAVNANVTGIGPFTFTWSALDGSPLPADVHSASLVFDSFQRANLGRYQVQVSGPGGSATAVAELRMPAALPRLANLSSRAPVGSGQDVLIIGLALDAPVRTDYKLVLRGAGPALASFGVAGPLPNPMLTMLDPAGSVLYRNDDWLDTADTRDWTSRAGAFPFATASRDSLLVIDSPGGNYTMTLHDASGASGTGLIEVYDVDRSDPLFGPQRTGALANLSLRGRVASATDPLIAGFVITDPANFDRPMKLLVRVVGPTLSGFGVSAPLANPRFSVFDAAGRTIAANDDWSLAPNASDTATAASRSGAFALPAGSKDAALALELPAGAYTVHATSADSSSGVALVEIYRLP